MSESTERISTGDWVDHVDYWNLSGVLQCLPIFSMALSCQMCVSLNFISAFLHNFSQFRQATFRGIRKCLKHFVGKNERICEIGYIDLHVRLHFGWFLRICGILYETIFGKYSVELEPFAGK